jgi:hypothetical protein
MMPFREIIIEGINWTETLLVHICKHCGDEAHDLANNIGVEWWSDEECGCHRSDDS